MIDDLIKRFAFGGNLDRDEIQELINEIERLQLTNKRVTETLSDHRESYVKTFDENQRLNDFIESTTPGLDIVKENIRLRELLKKISEGLEPPDSMYLANEGLKGGSTHEKQPELPGDGQ